MIFSTCYSDHMPNILLIFGFEVIYASEVLFYGSICVAKFNLQCNMQNGNAICKMAMYFCI